MTGRTTLLVTVASLAAGALNYLFQVHAATALDRADFGRFSGWLARFGVIATVATVAQFVSLDAPLALPRLSTALRMACVVAVGAFVVLVALGGSLPDVLLGAIGVASGGLLYAVVGQLQARLRLGLVAAALLTTTAVRFALPFAWPAATLVRGFYVAQSVAAFAGIVLATLLFRPAAATADHDPAVTPGPAGLRLGRPMLLAFASVVLPLLDVLVVSATRDAATTGAFSRMQLASRVVFFGGAAALAILLPHELHAAKTGTPMPAVARLIDRWLLPALLLGAILFGVVVDVAVLHPHGNERLWLHTTCVEAAVLVGLLGDINRSAAAGSLRTATMLTGAAIVMAVLAAVVARLWPGPAEGALGVYVVAAALGSTGVLVVARATRRRHREAA